MSLIVSAVLHLRAEMLLFTLERCDLSVLLIYLINSLIYRYSKYHGSVLLSVSVSIPHFAEVPKLSSFNTFTVHGIKAIEESRLCPDIVLHTALTTAQLH